MAVIGVAGRSSGVGKTRLIENLLGAFPGASVLKVTLGDEHRPPSVVTDPQALLTPGKDTWRYDKAGAGTIVWISCRRDDLASALREGLDVIGPGLLIVESNSAIREMDPDVVVFVEGKTRGDGSGRGSPKESAPEIRARADFVTSEPFENLDLIVERIREVVEMSEEKARNLITERVKDNRLPCAAAFKIAEEAGVSKKRIGEILNEMKVKVASCQLGCF